VFSINTLKFTTKSPWAVTLDDRTGRQLYNQDEL